MLLFLSFDCQGAKKIGLKAHWIRPVLSIVCRDAETVFPPSARLRPWEPLARGVQAAASAADTDPLSAMSIKKIFLEVIAVCAFSHRLSRSVRRNPKTHGARGFCSASSAHAEARSERPVPFLLQPPCLPATLHLSISSLGPGEYHSVREGQIQMCTSVSLLGGRCGGEETAVLIFSRCDAQPIPSACSPLHLRAGFRLVRSVARCDCIIHPFGRQIMEKKLRTRLSDAFFPETGAKYVKSPAKLPRT